MRDEAERFRNSRGFTLVELMIVVIIIGIGSVVAAGSIMQSRKNSLLTEVSRDTYNILETARSRALLRNVAVGLVLNRTNPGGASILLHESTDTSCNNIRFSGDPVRTNIELVDLSLPRYTGLTGTTIQMDRLIIGGASAGNNLFTFCMNRRGRLLQQSGGGWINVVGSPTLEIGYQRMENGNPSGVARSVRLEQGGTVRIMTTRTGG